MPKDSLTVIVPSRTQQNQSVFLERAIQSIRAQTIVKGFDLTVLVGVDAGSIFPGNLQKRLGFKIIESHGTSQAAALNAAIPSPSLVVFTVTAAPIVNDASAT